VKNVLSGFSLNIALKKTLGANKWPIWLHCILNRAVDGS
jgi:hypothetical protein